MANVQVIPAKKPILSAQKVMAPAAKRKVAAYARVSTDSEEQLNSYAAQVSYYTEYIQNRCDWEFAGIYTDEGITAVNTKHRDGFNKMVQDALDGKIQLIITKSVSRFARNTVDSLTTIRKLKDSGVEVYFEKEQIWTFDTKGELLISIMSSLAQEESRSISENVTLGKRKAMADGHISLPWSSVLGYERGEDGLPKIVPEQAEIVRLIYHLFMQGKSYTMIAKEMTERGIPTPMGKEIWRMATVRNILQNETYRGSKEMQKTFCVNYLTKSKKVNEGELPKYWIEESHEPIIPPDEFDAVQAEIERRKHNGGAYKALSPFSQKIVCGDCGAFFGSKVWNSNNKYRKVIWRCNDRYNKKGKRDCQTSHIVESEIKYRFITAYNKMMKKRDSLIDDCEMAIEALGDITEIDIKIKELEDELEVVEGLTLHAIDENKRRVINQEEWTERNGKYLKRHSEVTEQLKNLDDVRKKRLDKVKTMRLFVKHLKQGGEVITEWSEELWSAVIDCVVVGVDSSMTFRFKNGTEIVE